MTDRKWDRRTFFKASMLFAASLFTEKTAFARLPNLQQTPEGKLSLLNIHTHERLTVTYRNGLGEYDPEALKQLNWLLRCHYTNHATNMDLRVLEYLNQVDKNLGGGNEIQIISGYRSPAYNSELRREGHGGVAKHSFHTKGKALDIAIPGIGLKTVRRTALALAYGGVGYYSQPGFVHIDSGNFRVWGK